DFIEPLNNDGTYPSTTRLTALEEWITYDRANTHELNANQKRFKKLWNKKRFSSTELNRFYQVRKRVFRP
ncbi:TPA: hypothetical protein ACN976_004781, partial [Vibrio campbellii]